MSTAAAEPIAASDHAAIDQIVAHHADAWNRHDMHAFVADMTPDIDWINVVGMHWRGRDAVERAHAALHRTPLFADSRMIPGTLELRPLSADTILAVQRAQIEGAGPTPDGSPYPSAGAIQTLIFVRDATGWRIAHGHTTNINAQATANDPSARSPSTPSSGAAFPSLLD